MKNKIPVLFIVAGIFVTFFSTFADYFGLGKKGGVPAVQILAAEVGVVIILLGVGLFIKWKEKNSAPSSNNLWQGLLKNILTQSPIFWVLMGFLLAGFAFFIFPTFLNEQARFQYPHSFFIEREHIGFDTRLTLEHIRVWFEGEREPKYLFPALTTILFTPLLLLKYPEHYYVVTAITLVCYLILNLALPLLISSTKNKLIYFIFAISVFSYGFQFELETGQFYTIAMLCAALGIYIFHKYPVYRIFAYILFSISIQLKVFPAIFIFMFVDNWRDWKAIFKRFIALGLANFALLFLLGYPYFSLFFNHLLQNGGVDELPYNHSIYAFVTTQQLPAWVSTLLHIHFAICFLFILGKAYLRNEKGINTNLWMACLIGGLMLPTISHDYKLPLLMAPFAMVMCAQNIQGIAWMKGASILLITAASFAYSATLFPATMRPVWLENSYPFLFVILTAIVLLGFIQKPSNHQV